MKRLLAILLFVGLGSAPPAIAFYVGEHVALADTPPLDAGSSAISAPAADVGSALPTANPQATPADKIHDPLAEPVQTYNDYKATKKIGWGAAVLFVAIVSCRLLSKAGGFFKPLGTGRVALGIGVAGALAMTMYNAVMQGGSWGAAVMTAVVAAFAFWDSRAKPKEPAPAPAPYLSRA